MNDRMKMISEIIEKIDGYIMKKYYEGFYSEIVDIEEDTEKYEVIYLVNKNYQEARILYSK
ncbi:hypothetical protein K0B03_00070 [Patescibacteria group bacterium]|nr:hypothetical protein [Patescibacteria group bacterium]